MKFTVKKLSVLPVIAVLMSACSSGNSYREPDDCITGYVVRDKYDFVVNLMGNNPFADKMIVNEDGEEFSGSALRWFGADVSCCVNGFFRVRPEGSRYGSERYLLSTTLKEGNRLHQLGPYQSVGLFYEDVTPAAKKGEGIGYINRDGDVVFWLDKVLGQKGRTAENFMGGLSIVTAGADGDVKYGAIDVAGKLMLPLKYSYLEYAGSELWFSKEATKTEGIDIIDKKGNIVMTIPDDYPFYDEPDFKMLGREMRQFAFSGDYGLLWCSDTVWKIVDRSGKTMSENVSGIELKQNTLHNNDNFVFYDPEGGPDKDGAYGIMNHKGDIKVPAQFLLIEWLSDDMFCAMTFESEEDSSIKHKGGLFDYDGDLICYTEHAPFPIRNNYLCERADGKGKFYAFGDESNANIISAKYIDYIDECFGGASSDTDEMWMPEIEPKDAEKEVKAEKKVTDKVVIDVIGPVKSVTYYNNGNKSDTYMFDESGRLIQINGVDLTADNTTRDEQGRLTSFVVKDVDDLGYEMNFTTGYIYDDNVRLKTVFYDSDVASWGETLTRNENGLAIGYVVESDVEPNQVNYEYSVCDKKYNWTKLTTTDSYNNKNVVTRKIVYY